MNREARSWTKFAIFIGFLAIAFALASAQYLGRYPMPAQAGLAIYCCFLLLLVLAVAPAVYAPRSLISNAFGGRKRLLFIAVWCLPYGIYAAGNGDFHWQSLARLLAIAVPLPLIYQAVPVTHLSRFHWQDALAGSWLMSAVLFHGLHGIWTVPVNLDFMGRLFLLTIGAWTWTFLRPVPALGYQFSFSKHVLSAAAFHFTLFAALAIPASLAMHFTQWNPHWRGWTHFSLDFLEIWLFIALLEELFFRGFLQSLLSRSMHAPWQGQLVASCLFGLSHIVHAPVPNWRYVALASVAGWFYGSAFRSGGGLLASSLTHAMVDTAWRTWFSRI